MVRYIDEEKLIVSLMDYSKGKKTIGQCVTDTPTEDVAPIVHGKWIEEINEITKEKRYRCSNCNHYESKHTTIKGHYCWNCGAKMEEGDSNE